MTIYSVYYQMSGVSVSVTNKRLLAEETGIKEDKLTYHLTRLGKNFYRDKGIVIIKSEKLLRGGQRVFL